jgi:hypothetical protein
MSADLTVDALDVTVRLVAVGLAMTGAELIVDRAAFGRTGPFGPQVFAALRGGPPSLVNGSRAISVIATAQLLAAILLVAFGPLLLIGRWSLVALLATTTLIRRRRIVGGDGAEQMTDIVLISAALAVLPVPGDARITLAVIFIAAQALLSYFTAGIAKLISPIWRSGDALPAILGTYNHGLASVSHIMESRPAIAFVLGWSVIVFEILFPLILIAPPSVAIVVLGAGVTLHAGCAVLMGLNSFMWAFPATYACVWVIREIV